MTPTDDVRERIMAMVIELAIHQTQWLTASALAGTPDDNEELQLKAANTFTDEMMRLLSTERQEAKLELLMEMLRTDFREWKPANKPESEEEKGYQKGIIGQLGIVREIILNRIESLTQLTNNHD